MIWIYYGILAATFFATFAMMVQLGLWSNVITTINVVLSGLIAFGTYQAAGKFLVAKLENLATYTFIVDFICLWGVYVIAFLILQRLLANNLSRTRMRFKHPIDTVGGPLAGLVAAFLTTGIVGASLQAAPFDADVFDGVFTDTTRTSIATNPDLAWLELCQAALAPEKLGTANTPFRVRDYRHENNMMRKGLESQEKLRVRR